MTDLDQLRRDLMSFHDRPHMPATDMNPDLSMSIRALESNLLQLDRDHKDQLLTLKEHFQKALGKKVDQGQIPGLTTDLEQKAD